MTLVFTPQPLIVRVLCSPMVSGWVDGQAVSRWGAGGRQRKSCPGCIWATVRCRKLILGRDICWGCWCPTSWCDLDLTFDLANVTLIFSGLYSETVRCKRLILGIDIALGFRCATSWCDLHLTFDFVVVTTSFKVLSGPLLG